MQGADYDLTSCSRSSYQATVREDYSENGDAWSHFPHEHSRSRAYRWGEDGIGGISDSHQRLCFSLAVWNEQDPILKERLFGVTGHQGNHGEDVKELYYYLDSTPTHSYMKFLYKYPQRRYPYEELVNENVHRDRNVEEYEILDTDIFDDDRYWDIFVEVSFFFVWWQLVITKCQYAKDEDDPDNVYIRITSYNRGPDPATLHVIPQLWFRNTWSWPAQKPPMPSLSAASTNNDISYIKVKHPDMGKSFLCCLPSPPPVGADGKCIGDEDAVIQPDLLFTENDTNFTRLYGGINQSAYVKDAFHDHIIPSHRPDCSDSKAPRGSDTPAASASTRSAAPQELPYVSSEKRGTKSAAQYIFRDVPGRGGCAVVRLKLTPLSPNKDQSIEDEGAFDDVIEERREEANEFYSSLLIGPISDDLKQVMRQALGGMLWTKQFYYFVQKEWIEGDPAQPPPPPGRRHIRNEVSQI